VNRANFAARLQFTLSTGVLQTNHFIVEDILAVPRSSGRKRPIRFMVEHTRTEFTTSTASQKS